MSKLTGWMTFPFSDLSGGGDGYMKFEIGSTAYIVERNRIVREVKIVKQNGNFYIVRFGTSGEIQVRSNRLKQRRLRKRP